MKQLERELKRKEKALAETAALLQGKMEALWAEVDDSTRQQRGRGCCEVVGIGVRTVQRWRQEGDGGEDQRRGPNTVPASKLSEHEEHRLLRVPTSPENRDLSPRQVIPALAEQGTYIASEATAYRVLHKQRCSRSWKRPRYPVV